MEYMGAANSEDIAFACVAQLLFDVANTVRLRDARSTSGATA
jgi:hypothetical protein